MKVIEDLGMKVAGSRKRRFLLVECSCGETLEIRADSKRNSCNKCISKHLSETTGDRSRTHGKSGTLDYKRYNNMKNRCYNEKSKDYIHYGGRGITICQEWLNSFESYYNHISSLANAYKEGYTIDRIDNNGNYEPNNVRWADTNTQRRNTRVRTDNTSGTRGVSLHKLTNKYSAYVGSVYLGLFDTKEEALASRVGYIKANKIKGYNE